MKLKRLVSAILAVGMMVAMLPVSAFADGTDTGTAKYIKGIILNADGTIDYKAVDPNCTEGTDGSGRYWAASNGSWRYYDGINRLVIREGWTFDENSTTTKVKIPFDIFNNGTITSGDFGNTVTNYGTIKGGNFEKRVTNTAFITGGTYYEISNRNWYTHGATVEGSLIGNYVLEVKDGGQIKNSVVWNSLKESSNGTTTSGIFPAESKYIAEGSKYYEIEAPGCTITSSYNNYDFSIKEDMWVIDESETPEMTVTVTPVSTDRKVSEWKVEGISIDADKLKGNSITFTVPAGNTENIKVTAEMEKISLSVSNDLPADGKNSDGTYGSKYDCWYYAESKNNKNEFQKNLTVYPDYIADIGNEDVDWTIQNNGTIAEGKFTGIVNNYGNITGGTYTGNFYNRNTTDNPNANAVREEGIVTSGVFSRSADFGTQNPDITWLTVKNNATINGIKDFTMAGIVGEQSVTITAPTGFKCWSVSGDSDLTLTEEQKHSNPLVLDLKGADKSNIILTAQSEEGYYPLNLTDGKAYSVTADGAKDKEITAARAGDTVILEADATLIPDGMVFDRWEITGDTELTGGFDANAEKTQFTMPNAGVTIRAMYRMADVEEPNVLGTAAVIGTVAVGGAVIAWQGYNIAADIYARDILPEGTAIPETKEALAVMLWQNAGKPEVVAADGSALTETEQAQQWVIANGLMENEEDGTFHPEKGVGKFAALNAIKEQQETANAQ